MGERVNDPRLQKLRDAGIELYSISKLDSINNCLYSSYLTYRLGDKGGNNIYAIMGGKLHDVLEGMANGTNTKDDLLPAMKAELEDMDMLGIKFPSDKIRENWINDITHFCETFDFVGDKKFETEQLFIYKTDDGHYIQGYIDLIKNVNDNVIEIYDHKSSSMYNSKEMDEHARQLIVYMLGKQQEGFKVNKIAWHFMKYAEVTYPDTRGNIKTKIVERRKIYDEMEKYIELALLRSGCDAFDADLFLMDAKQDNSFDKLPEAVKKQFSLRPAIIEYEVDNEVVEDCKKYIRDTIAKWESLEGKDESAYTPREFTKTQKNGKTVPDVFFCQCLCSHADCCPHIHRYLEKLESKDDEYGDLFS